MKRLRNRLDPGGERRDLAVLLAAWLLMAPVLVEGPPVTDLYKAAIYAVFVSFALIWMRDAGCYVLHWRQVRRDFAWPVAPMTNWKDRAILATWGLATPILNCCYVVRLWYAYLCRRRVAARQNKVAEQIAAINRSAGNPTHCFVLLHGQWAMPYAWSRWQNIIDTTRTAVQRPAYFPFPWRAVSSIRMRITEAQRLVRFLRRLPPTAKIVLIGHSHGGTVAFEALRMRHCPKNVSAVTIGMPPFTPETQTLPFFAGAVPPTTPWRDWSAITDMLILGPLAALPTLLTLEPSSFLPLRLSLLLTAVLVIAFLARYRRQFLAANIARRLARFRIRQEGPFVNGKVVIDGQPCDVPTNDLGLIAGHRLKFALSRTTMLVAREDEIDWLSQFQAYANDMLELQTKRATELNKRLDALYRQHVEWAESGPAWHPLYRSELFRGMLLYDVHSPEQLAALAPDGGAILLPKLSPMWLAVMTGTASLGFVTIAVQAFRVDYRSPALVFTLGVALAAMTLCDSFIRKYKSLQLEIVVVKSAHARVVALSPGKRFGIHGAYDQTEWSSFLGLQDLTRSIVPVELGRGLARGLALPIHRISLEDESIASHIAAAC